MGKRCDDGVSAAELVRPPPSWSRKGTRFFARARAGALTGLTARPAGILACALVTLGVAPTLISPATQGAVSYFIYFWPSAGHFCELMMAL